jgi:hypothetical protein
MTFLARDFNAYSLAIFGLHGTSWIVPDPLDIVLEFLHPLIFGRGPCVDLQFGMKVKVQLHVLFH